MPAMRMREHDGTTRGAELARPHCRFLRRDDSPGWRPEEPVRHAALLRRSARKQ
jgi:hypothetical protein